jgi:cytoskeletal protein CcmA (bactofilin family)
MAKNDSSIGGQPGREGVISIIGPGMRVTGDCETEGTLRVEGAVEGTVRAGKAVVVGKDGVVDGDIQTQDAVVGGRVNGSIAAESRLELQATCVIEGEIRARRIKLEEGGKVNGTVHIGDTSASGSASAGGRSRGSAGSSGGSSSASGGSAAAASGATSSGSGQSGPGQSGSAQSGSSQGGGQGDKTSGGSSGTGGS